METSSETPESRVESQIKSPDAKLATAQSTRSMTDNIPLSPTAPSPGSRRERANSQLPPPRKQGSTARIPSLPPSITSSPDTSRPTSPIRPSIKDATQHGRHAQINLLKTANQDISSFRPLSSQSSGPPSAASIQRALSAANVVTSQSGPLNDAVSRLQQKYPKSVPPSEAATPTSPALSSFKSPQSTAPSSRRNSIPKKPDNINPPPPITVQKCTPPPTAIPDGSGEKSSDEFKRGASGSNRPGLETVQEGTPPSSNLPPDHSLPQAKPLRTKSISGEESTATDHTRENHSFTTTESETDNGKRDTITKKDNLTIDHQKTRILPSKSAPSTGRAKLDGTRNMTVETETVSSIPQTALSVDRSTSQKNENGGSVRLKQSMETIRARKDRKRTSRKAISLQNGTASSKADIFEAKVASQVDEADSSDSDETFVYESNPAESQLRATRNHSRTPSVSSIHSQGERKHFRGFDNHRVAGKRSMKFSNNPNSYGQIDSATDGEFGATIRAYHPRNISRFGRGLGSSSSLYDQDGSFAQAAKLRQSVGGGSIRQSSRPTTPATLTNIKSLPGNGNGNGTTDRHNSIPPWIRKQDNATMYDFDVEGADDERTPLMGTVRTPRTRQRRSHMGRPYDNIYNINNQTSWTNRFGGIIFTSIIVFLVVIATTSLLLLTNKTLYSVRVIKIQNVLASEQELMLDLFVGAINPNILGIEVTDMDVNIFAKSKLLAPPPLLSSSVVVPVLSPSTVFSSSSLSSPTSFTRKKINHYGSPWQDPDDGSWHPYDPDTDDDDFPDDKDAQTMLLGRVFAFDSPLYFEGSPLKRISRSSIGELRLAKPGNKTESGGSERWERVLQGPFELILRGVLKYNLPVSGVGVTSAVAGKIYVRKGGIV